MTTSRTKRLVAGLLLLSIAALATAESLTVFPATGYGLAHRSFRVHEDTAALVKHTVTLSGTHIWAPGDGRFGFAMSGAWRYPLSLSFSENGEPVDADISQYTRTLSSGVETTIAAAYSLPFGELHSFVTLGATMDLLVLAPTTETLYEAELLASLAIGPQVGWTVGYPLRDRLGVGASVRVGYVVYEPFGSVASFSDDAILRGGLVATLAVGLSVTGW